MELIEGRKSRFNAAQIEYVWLIVLASVTGSLAALGNLGFRLLISVFSWTFRAFEWSALGIDRGGWFALLTPIVLLTGGAALLLLNWLFPDEVLGYGFPNFLAMVHLGGARIKRRWIFLKAISSAVSLGAGASVGREGPIAQIGGSIGSAVARAMRMGAQRAKVLVACGAGAGIATTFNAPIGGLLFAQEIVLLGETELANLSLLIISTTVAVVTSGALSGNEMAVFKVPAFELRSYWELITYCLMGLTMGLVSAGYIRLFHATAAMFERMRLPISAKLGIGLAVVGLIAIPLPQNLSDGYPVINAALAGQLHVPRMAILAIAKIFASCLSLGCGAPGGVFGPIFFIGAMGGGSFRAISEAFFPHFTGPRGSYALVGLGAFLASTTHAPLTAVFLLFEMTREYEITVPALLSSILALVVARAIESESIDTFSLARQGKTLHIGRDRQLLMQLPVSAAMNPTPDSVRSNDSFSEVLRKAGETAQVILPVIGDESALLGVIATRELLPLVTSREDLANLGIAADLCEKNAPTLVLDENLDEATRLMEAEGVEEVPVAGVDGCLVGLLSRSAIRNALSRAAVSMVMMARSDEPITWSADYRVAQIAVGLALRGKSIRQLNARSLFGVNIVAIRNGHDLRGGFGPADPDRPLEVEDVLLVAGSPNSVRAFEREATSHRSQSLKELPTKRGN
jgi:CIC family chloride channel protein